MPGGGENSEGGHNSATDLLLGPGGLFEVELTHPGSISQAWVESCPIVKCLFQYGVCIYIYIKHVSFIQ